MLVAESQSTNDRVVDIEGKLGLHPAKRNGKVDPKKVRLIGEMPEGAWAQFQRGFITNLKGTRHMDAMAYLGTEENLPAWLDTPIGLDGFEREAWLAPTFQVQNTRRFGIYLRVNHPLVVAIRNAMGKDLIGTSPVLYRYRPSFRSITLRVPLRKDVRDYSPTRERAIAQGELPL